MTSCSVMGASLLWLVLVAHVHPLCNAFELWVGARDLRPTSNTILWLLNSSTTSDWGDGVSVGYPPIYNLTDLSALSAAGLRLLPCIHSSLETMQRQLFDNPPSVPDTASFASAYTHTLPDFEAGTAQGPQPFMWWSLVEDDSSGVGFPYSQLGVRPSTHGDAHAQFDAYLQRAQVLSMALSAQGTPLIAQVGFAEQVHAHFARGVDLAIIERANDDIGDLGTALAFARGGAKQFNASFGIDLSWWWGVLYSGVNRLPSSYHRRHAYGALLGGATVVNIEGGDGLCDGDGAPLALGQEVEAFGRFARAFFTPPPSEPRVPSQQQHRVGLGPSVLPLTPVLLAIPKDHGYATKPYWLSQQQGYGYARLPPRQGDAALRGIFNLLLPGAGFAQDPFPFGAFAVDDPPASMWALSSQTPPYAPRLSDTYSAAPYLPFGKYANRTQAASDFQANPRDPSTARPMGDSTWGNVVDVAVTGLGLAGTGVGGGAPNNVWGSGRQGGNMGRRKGRGGGGGGGGGRGSEDDPPLPLSDGYKLCILLGPVNLTASLKAQLLDFARAGGQVILSVGVVGPGDGDLTGISTLVPEMRVGRSWRWVQGGSPAQHEPFRYLPCCGGSTATPTTGTGSSSSSSSSSNFTVLATTVAPIPACGGGPCPLAVRWGVGEGSVTTILLPWMEGESGLSQLAAGVVGRAIAGVAPLELSWEEGGEGGWPVDFSTSLSPDKAHIYALVSNNEEAVWRGGVTFTPAAGPTALGQCMELRSGTPLPLDASGRSLALVVPPMDVAVVRCGATW